MKYIIHIDSASGISNNVAKSAYAYYIKSNNGRIIQQNSKIRPKKSKQQMILIGLINALANILYQSKFKSDTITVTTNSLYLVHPFFSNQIKKWSKYNFKHVKNGDLWKELINITHLLKHLNFQWKKQINQKTNHMLIKIFNKYTHHRYFNYGQFNYKNIINDVNQASLKAPKNPKYFKQWKLDTVPAYKFNNHVKHYQRISTKYGFRWKKLNPNDYN